MEYTHTEEALIKRWQFLQLKSMDSNLTPFQRADYTRQLMELPRYSAALKFTQLGDVEQLTRKLADRYSSIVDNPTGVNNYAEGALALNQGRRNDSKLWTTSLDKNRLFQRDSVKKLMEASKVAQESLVPQGKENAVLFRRVKVKASGEGSTSATNGNDIRASALQQLQPQPLFKKTEKPQPEKKFAFSNTRVPHENAKASMDQVAPQRTFNSSEQLTTMCNASANRVHPPSNPSTTVPGTAYNPIGRPFNNSAYRSAEPQKRPFSEVESGGDAVVPTAGAFKTAREQLVIDQQKKYGAGRGGQGGSVSTAAYGSNKKSLGTRRGLNSKFVPPVMTNRGDDYGDDGGAGALVRGAGPTASSRQTENTGEEPIDERLKNIEPKMVELITNEIMDLGPSVEWDDIAGLEFAKKTVREIIVLPMLRPDIFTGIRAPPKGLLLFGPPGTGKTLIGKCIASQAKSTFFSISASSLTSKWVGEGEKMVRALFAVARINQPAVIFIDEIDSLLSQRSDGEHDASRRIKTEFLVQLDGATTSSEDRILVVGATNRPQEIDEAARRRFVKRLYIPLPESAARQHIVRHLMSQQNHNLTDKQILDIAENTSGYSGADMANLCSEAAYGPIRGLSIHDIESIAADEVRPITHEDFQTALQQVKPSVSSQDLGLYIEWNKQFGSWQIE